MAMVNALENEGKRSVTDLAYFISDPSEDVAEAAFSAWTMLLQDIQGDRRVRAILETAQILQGHSNGHWQGHGPSGAPMAAPGPGALPLQAVPMAAPAAIPAQPVPVTVPVMR